MKRVQTACAAALFGLVLAVLPSISAARADVLVMELDVANLPKNARLSDETRVNIPDGATLRVLIEPSGDTKTLKGPYEGTIAGYKDDRSWWERITGRSKDSDAPIGATRGIRAN